MKDVVLDEVKEKYMISKEDFKNYFNEREIISKEEYIVYLKTRKNNNNFNAIFNATPKKSYKKRSGNIKSS